MTSFLVPGIEIITTHPLPHHRVQGALFDFDGTLSRLREGWDRLMLDLVRREIGQAPDGARRDSPDQVARDIVYGLEGRPTIDQMAALAEELKRRGVEPRDPLAYKQDFLFVLGQVIAKRKEQLATGVKTSGDWTVKDARSMLGECREHNVVCYVASGTDHDQVTGELQLLGLAEFFGDRVLGARPAATALPKVKAFELLTAKHQLASDALVGFGDSPDDVRTTKSAGAIAVGIAADDERRARLVQAGADIIMRDYTQHKGLAENLFRS